MEDTYTQVMDIGGTVEQLQHHLRAAANDLSCTTRLILLLIQLRPDIRLGDEDAAMLAHFLSPIVVDNESQGWEETTDAALTHLLKTSLAKTAKDSVIVHQPLVMPKDTSRLKKHIQIVCDRLKKGASLTGKPSRSGERDEGKEEGKAPSGPTEASGGRGEEKGEEKGS
uniref:PTHB1 C-terminal domain-containing protein n=1 Tax=Florenciella parvula TaxID=236787 RepID=A0A7S2FQC3_9STRA|mmetsp:Transcript_20948/g.43876  ORF Transcript_20948/g.43876 Transcript_20948/m.43876 type:complete len:169 (+) Transcript_20948:3-509(+)